jgi:hypothetical protein
MLVTKPSGEWVCYVHDGLHRVTDVGNSSQTTMNACKRFRYDNTGGALGRTAPGTVLNTLGRLEEVETDSGSTVTDEWFSYSARGELTDVYESTPHSGGYYHTTSSYWPTGTLEAVPRQNLVHSWNE